MTMRRDAIAERRSILLIARATRSLGESVELR